MASIQVKRGLACCVEILILYETGRKARRGALIHCIEGMNKHAGEIGDGSNGILRAGVFNISTAITYAMRLI